MKNMKDNKILNTNIFAKELAMTAENYSNDKNYISPFKFFFIYTLKYKSSSNFVVIANENIEGERENSILQIKAK